MTCRAGGRDALGAVFLCHLGKVLIEVGGVIVDDWRSVDEGIILELRVVSLEAVELDDMAGPALLVRNVHEIGMCALVFLMARRASDATPSGVMGRKKLALSPSNERRWRS